MLGIQNIQIFIWSLIWIMMSCQPMPIHIHVMHDPVMQQSSKTLERNKETVMIETLWETCQVLTKAPLSVEEVAEKLGKILQNSGGNAPVIIQPYDLSFKEAMIVREINSNSNEPAFVKFTLSKPGQLPLSVLSDRFGNYSVPPKVHFNSPTKVIFYLDQTNSPYNCAIVADFQPEDQEVEKGRINAVTIRRDIKLPK